MEDIRQWIKIISAVTIIGGILSALLPRNNLKSAYKMLFGVVFVYAVMLPAINYNMFDLNIGNYLDDNYEISESFDKYSKQAIVDSAEKSIEDLFYSYSSEHNISCDFMVKCVLGDEKILISELDVLGDITEKQKAAIIDFAVNSGLDKNIIFFSGEKNE